MNLERCEFDDTELFYQWIIEMILFLFQSQSRTKSKVWTGSSNKINIHNKVEFITWIVSFTFSVTIRSCTKFIFIVTLWMYNKVNKLSTFDTWLNQLCQMQIYFFLSVLIWTSRSETMSMMNGNIQTPFGLNTM